MPTYYFDVADGVCVVDDTGAQLPDDEAARQHAIRISSDMLKSADVARWRGDEWRVHVRDEDSRTVYTLAFRANAPA